MIFGRCVRVADGAAGRSAWALLAVGLGASCGALGASCCYQPKRDSWPSLSAEIRLPAVAATFRGRFARVWRAFPPSGKRFPRSLRRRWQILLLSRMIRRESGMGAEPAGASRQLLAVIKADRFGEAPGALVGHKAGMAARHAVPVAHRIPSNDPTRPKTMMTRRQSLARPVDQRVLMPVVPVVTRCWFPVVRPGAAFAAFSCWRQITRMRHCCGWRQPEPSGLGEPGVGLDGVAEVVP